jgi:ubiquinone/menaquinone biosynthesis C-methylase UbiE
MTPQTDTQSTLLNQIHRKQIKETVTSYLTDTDTVLLIGDTIGQYTYELASKAKHIYLSHASDIQLSIAKETLDNTPNTSVSQHELTDLAFESNTFDIVLCLGSLSHLSTTSDQAQALTELQRVTTPSGWVFITVASRYSILQNILITSAVTESNTKVSHIKSIAKTGTFFRDTDWYFYTSQELQEKLTDAEYTNINAVGLESITSGMNINADTAPFDREQQKAIIESIDILDNTIAPDLSTQFLMYAQVPTQSDQTNWF